MKHSRTNCKIKGKEIIRITILVIFSIFVFSAVRIFEISYRIEYYFDVFDSIRNEYNYSQFSNTITNFLLKKA